MKTRSLWLLGMVFVLGLCLPFIATADGEVDNCCVSRVRLTIYSVRGETVRILVDEPRNAGWHEVAWDGRNSSGRDVASGIYLYVLEVEGQRLLKKMLLIR